MGKRTLKTKTLKLYTSQATKFRWNLIQDYIKKFKSFFYEVVAIASTLKEKIKNINTWNCDILLLTKYHEILCRIDRSISSSVCTTSMNIPRYIDQLVFLFDTAGTRPLGYTVQNSTEIWSKKSLMKKIPFSFFLFVFI